MSVVTMPVMAVAMAMVPVMAVVAVTSTVPAVSTVAAMPTVTVTAASESLTGDGQRGSCQRQSSDSGRNDLLDPSHGRLLGCAARGSLCDEPT